MIISQLELKSKFRLMCEGGCIYLSTESKGAPPMASKSVLDRLGISGKYKILTGLDSV